MIGNFLTFGVGIVTVFAFSGQYETVVGWFVAQETLFNLSVENRYAA